MYDLTGKIALVTGIGGPVDALGNGKAIAMLLARQGAIIEGTDIDEAAGANTVAAIRDARGMAHCTRVDATDQTGVEDWVKACAAKHGKIDILVNNVGQSEPGGPASMTVATWQAQIALNLDSVFYTMQAVLPYMVAAQAGSIINISSIYGLLSPDLGIYSNLNKANPPYYGAAKAALIQYTKYTACEFAKDGIRVNSISPGAFPSPKFQKIHPNTVKKLKSKIPLKRIGKPEDIIGPLMYLATSSSKYVTGTNIIVDGGYSTW